MSKDARRRASLYYQHHGRELASDCAKLMSNPRAVFVWLPQLVVMMKPALSRDLQDVQNLAMSPSDADSWYVHLLVGDVACALELAQELEPLPLLCFQRGSRSADFHICPWARFIQSKLQQNRKNN